jgi:hypothetical protein
VTGEERGYVVRGDGKHDAGLETRAFSLFWWESAKIRAFYQRLEPFWASFFHLYYDFLPLFCRNKNQKKPENPKFVYFGKLLLCKKTFFNFETQTLIHGSRDSFIFDKKARNRSSYKIRDSIRHYHKQT